MLGIAIAARSQLRVLARTYTLKRRVPKQVLPADMRLDSPSPFNQGIYTKPRRKPRGSDFVLTPKQEEEKKVLNAATEKMLSQAKKEYEEKKNAKKSAPVDNKRKIKKQYVHKDATMKPELKKPWVNPAFIDIYHSTMVNPFD